MWTKLTYLNTLISLISGIEHDRHYSFEEIAEMVGCSVAQAKKLTEELCKITVPNLAGLGESILPIELDESGILLHDSFSFSTAHPIRLDRMQTIAAIVALRMLGVPWDDECMRALCDGVTTDVAIEHLSRIIDVTQPRYTTKTMEVLAQGVLDGCCVEIMWGSTARVIEPWLILSEKDKYYIYGWCHLRDMPRMFRIDRIKGATLLTHLPASHPYAETVDQAYPDLEGAPYTARLHFDDSTSFNPYDWAGARVIGTTRPGLTIELPYTTPEWIAARIVASLGDVEALGPKEVREAVVEYATSVRSLCGVGR
ncbi:MAG: WYL domain-containing protein [Coriobacteriia bacterium]|nr:WYL domain-containing protein [Coriobacteriia bacterium]